MGQHAPLFIVCCAAMSIQYLCPNNSFKRIQQWLIVHLAAWTVSLQLDFDLTCPKVV